MVAISLTTLRVDQADRPVVRRVRGLRRDHELLAPEAGDNLVGERLPFDDLTHDQDGQGS